MPLLDVGAPGQALAPINGEIKKEIKQLFAGLTNIANLKREANAILEGEIVHVDSKKLPGTVFWKVDIQYRRQIKSVYKGKTIAIIKVSETATSLPDVRTAVANALNNDHVWEVI